MSPRPLQNNAADGRQLRHAKRAVEREQERFDAALAAVLQLREGRIVIAALLERSGLTQTVYDTSGSTMYFKEGRRNFGLEIASDCWRVAPEATELMERERRERDRGVERESAAHQQPEEGQEPEQHVAIT